MANSIRTNLMAGNAARTLGSHYNRLSKSVQRLSSGLRINSAADDAAGLAIRELMRADVSTLNQGIRNANDAISMIQTADGALAVIDEKLIRMKELAEQAATGTYNSTQRLIISSEYQAMAAEIDRIANATDFNGIKLLDGSLSGTHNGKGLNSTGAMKIHFGTGNASAEDYYYVEIGGCTTEALGLGGITFSPPTITYETKYITAQTEKTFKPSTSFVEYTDPETGNKYYTDGDYYFTDTNDPAGTALDWATDGELIARLVMQHKTVSNTVYYRAYVDPNTAIEYYSRDSGRTFLLDPQDTLNTLDPANATEKAIIDRLQETNRSIGFLTIWHVYEDPSGKEYYTCDNGNTFVPNISSPSNNVLDTSNPAHKAITDTFIPVLTSKSISAPSIPIEYECYTDPVTNIGYYSSDGGKSFVVNIYTGKPVDVDPVANADIIARLKRSIESTYKRVNYDRYMDPNTNTIYLTSDRRKTFVLDVTTPENIVLSADNPADTAKIDNLVPVFFTRTGHTECDIYEDRADNNKRYYTKDGGNTYFDDLTDPAGSILDKNNPNYAATVANFQKLDSKAILQVTYNQYFDPGSGPDHVSGYLFSADGGQTFVLDEDKPDEIRLNIANPDEKIIIDRLEPVCQHDSVTTYYEYYTDPDTGKRYITLSGGSGNLFYESTFTLDTVALDVGIASQKIIIDRLQPSLLTVTANLESSFPAMYWIYENPETGKIYYSPDNGQTFTTYPRNPYLDQFYLDPAKPADKAILDKLRPQVSTIKTGEYLVAVTTPGTATGSGGAAISTQEAAQKALVAIDNAIVSKDKIRAHLGALQNRLENTVTNLSIQAENLQASESRISDTDVATEMTAFVRNQVLTQSATAMLSQANSFPHMLMRLLG